MLITLLVFATLLAQNTNIEKENLDNFELEEKTLLISDSLVKNYDENNTLLGGCVLDNDKKRVLTNQLNSENLQKAKKEELGEYTVQKISLNFGSKTEEIELDNNDYTNCLASKRFVLVDGKKTILEVKVCKKT